MTVADPKPPTAEVTLKAPEWLAPGDNVTVLIQATSLIGTSVADASMKLYWTLNLPYSPQVGQPSDKTGVVSCMYLEEQGDN